MLRCSALRNSSVRGFLHRAPHQSNINSLNLLRPFCTPTQQNISFEIKDKVALLRINCPDSKVNTLNKTLGPEIIERLNDIKKSHMNDIMGVVLISDKKDNFIAGADIAMLAKAKTELEAQELSRGGQEVMSTIEQFEKPVVAAINGSCLGGGLEVALACHSRVATESPKTMLGLPEVMLGLLPGAGGTQRLPKLVGLTSSLDMMLKGKNIRPKKAKRMGLVDVTCDPSALETAAIKEVQTLASGGRQRKASLSRAVLEGTPIVNFVWSGASKAVQKSTGGKYPAPKAIIECVKTGHESGLEAGSEKEATEFGKLAMTEESKSLISLFFAQTALKKNRFGAPSNSYDKVAVLGAGLMGAGIAEVSVAKGMSVVMYDRDLPSLARGEKQVYDSLSSKVKRKAMSEAERNRTLSKIVSVVPEDSSMPAHLKDVSMIIEAVPEDLKLKHQVLGNLENIVSEDCIIATNTSALPIGAVAAGLKRPQNVVGMHYFSPVPKMPLLEVIVPDSASQEARAAAVQVGIRQGKTVIVVKDGPGFYTTRILAPFMMEAVLLLQEGIPIKTLDKALREFGFPVGPVTLMDEVGIDVGQHIAKFLGEEFGERLGASDHRIMDFMTSNKFLGRKTQKGFFVYGKGKKKEENEQVVDFLKSNTNDNFDVEEMQHRTAYRMINEAVMCLEEGILESATDGDVGAVFGLGFPPFHGGPFRYIDRVGADKVLKTLEKYEAKFGARFTPSKLLREHASNGTKFHQE